MRRRPNHTRISAYIYGYVLVNNLMATEQQMNLRKPANRLRKAYNKHYPPLGHNKTGNTTVI